MRLITQILILIVSYVGVAGTTLASGNKGTPTEGITRSEPAVLWRNPSNLAERDLYYGPGGRQHAPRGVFTFVKEDAEGTNPKFIVTDQDGVKWKVKLGDEAQPETVAARFVWAMGYFADEDYYLPELRVRNMPPKVHRGRKWVRPDGTMYGVRMERPIENEEKLGNWTWRTSPFTGTHELNRLRVLMAVMNNWDLKDSNNAVYERDHKQIYEIADLGGTFGTPGLSWSKRRSKGDLDTYQRSKFIRKVTPHYVDFAAPARPSWVTLVNPGHYFMRLHLQWIGRKIPREDARFMGKMLARLSRRQIRSAFEAAGYSPTEVEGYARIVESRIGELNEL